MRSSPSRSSGRAPGWGDSGFVLRMDDLQWQWEGEHDAVLRIQVWWKMSNNVNWARGIWYRAQIAGRLQGLSTASVGLMFQQPFCVVMCQTTCVDILLLLTVMEAWSIRFLQRSSMRGEKRCSVCHNAISVYLFLMHDGMKLKIVVFPRAQW